MGRWFWGFSSSLVGVGDDGVLRAHVRDKLLRLCVYTNVGDVSGDNVLGGISISVSVCIENQYEGVFLTVCGDIKLIVETVNCIS